MCVSTAVRRFTTTGLCRWKGNINPEVAQQSDRSFSGFREECVYQTGGKKLNSHVHIHLFVGDSQERRSPVRTIRVASRARSFITY
jgi:hypothetical protein